MLAATIRRPPPDGMRTTPATLLKTLTLDNGKEFARTRGVGDGSGAMRITITQAQGNALFLAVYSAEARYPHSVATSATVVQLYGPTNWDTLNQKIKDILIDMTYRGDYTPYANADPEVRGQQ